MAAILLLSPFAQSCLIVYSIQHTATFQWHGIFMFLLENSHNFANRIENVPLYSIHRRFFLYNFLDGSQFYNNLQPLDSMKENVFEWNNDKYVRCFVLPIWTIMVVLPQHLEHWNIWKPFNSFYSIKVNLINPLQPAIHIRWRCFLWVFFKCSLLVPTF